MPAGVYYIPVLPAQLTTKKGIDLKLSFLDGKTARAFNGNGLKLKSGKVYDMGTVKKTDIFVENGFETGNISYFVTDNKDAQGNKAISIVKNPYQTDINPSDSVLCDNMYTKTNNTSGFFEVQTGNEAGYIRFPSSVRGFYGTLRIKMYLGTNAYYPRVKRGSNSPALPKYLNGVEVTSQEVWDANVKTDDWNILEYIPSMIDSGWTDFANLATYQIRPFVNYSGGNTEGFDETTNNRLIWIDDITFVLK